MRATTAGDGLRVLVLGDRPEVALWVCRSLARAGHVVGVGTSHRAALSARTRAASHHHLLAGPDAAAGGWAGIVAAVVDQQAYDVVLATSDADVARLADLPSSVVRSPVIGERQAALLDKARLASVCRSVSVSYPRTLVPSAESEDEALAMEVDGPAVVKASRPAVLFPGGVSHLQGAHVVHNSADAAAAMTHYRRAGLDPILQERVIGAKLQGVIIRRSGQTTCRFVVAVEREMPPAGGAETTLRQLASDSGVGAEVVTSLERVADETSYEGILQAEFLLSPTGRLWLVDANPRLWGSVAFAELVGLRMAERVARDALGHPAPALPPERPGRRYHHVFREARYARARPREAWALVRSWSGGDVRELPSVADPGPELGRLRARLRR